MIYDVRMTIYDIQCMILNIRFTKYDFRHTMYDFKYTIYPAVAPSRTRDGVNGTQKRVGERSLVK